MEMLSYIMGKKSGGGGPAPSGTLSIGANGTYDVTNYAQAAVDVPGGADTAEVTFIDYDGTVRYTYSAEEFAELTAMPENPSHEGLVAQGWNWSLEDAQAYVEKYGMLIVGQMYATTSGATEIDIELSEGRLSPWLHMAGSGTFSIEWGDGSEPETGATMPVQHNYAAPGKYTISVTVLSGTRIIHGDSYWHARLLTGSKNSSYETTNSCYRRAVRAVRIAGESVTIGDYAFETMRGLNYVTMPRGLTIIGGNAFSSVYSIHTIVIPDGVTSIGRRAFQYDRSVKQVIFPNSINELGTEAFYQCYSLAAAILPEGPETIQASTFEACRALKTAICPDTVKTIGQKAFYSCESLRSATICEGVQTINKNAFYGCKSLQKIKIPSSVETLGDDAFSGCYSLTEIDLPSGVSSIGARIFAGCTSLQKGFLPSGLTGIPDQAFFDCTLIKEIRIPESVTSIGGSAFSSCNCLQQLTIPDGVTSIGGSAFSNCNSLQKIKIPSGVTSLQNYAFSGMELLTTIIIPGGVTSIGSSAFSGCSGLSEVDMTALNAVPTLANTNAFSNIPSDCVFKVKAELLEEFQTATNWSTYADRFVGV